MASDQGYRLLSPSNDSDHVPDHNYYKESYSDDTNDEDTEEASETDSNCSKIGKNKGFKPGIDQFAMKEEMYHVKLTTLLHQLQQLKDGSHPEYKKQLAKLQDDYDLRIVLNEVTRVHLTDVTEHRFAQEVKAASKEYEEKKIELKDNLISEYEHRKRVIKSERYSLKLIEDNKVKPPGRRKLRRRSFDTTQVSEKRRKPLTQLNFLLDSKEIEMDYKAIYQTPYPNHPWK